MRALYKDRVDAGRRLAGGLLMLSTEKPLVLAIPRGGVVVGYEVASALRSQLDIVVPRKLGAPGQPELALGAVMHDGSLFLNQDVISISGATKRYIEEERGAQVEESRRRLAIYRKNRQYPKLQGRFVIIVDDGVATGATLITALRWAKEQRAKRVIAAFPVGPAEMVPRLRREADEVVCPYYPEPFYAIGQFYESFESVEDDEVVRILEEAWKES